jgi:tripartite-type tricarboxylate transporter receptor subunit TctC
MTKITRRTLVLGSMAAPFAQVGPADAQTASSNIIKFIVPFPPGGTADPIARMLQPGLQQRLGATVVVENRPGASGSIGTAAAAKSPPDGTTLVIVFDTHAVNPFLQTLPFDTEKDLDPVLWIGTAPNILATNPARPYQTFADVIAAAKAKPDAITYGSIGSGSLGHLTMALLTERAGVRMVHVPYRGGGPLMNDAIANHIDVMIASAALVTPQVRGGTLRGLLQTGKTRIPALPGLPTAIDAGFAGFESYAWWGILTPAPTPKPILDRLNAAVSEALRDPTITKNISENMQITMRFGGPDELRQFVSEQMKLWGSVVRQHGIKGET